MPASSTQYGSYQPNAVDPYPIESVLAPLAVGNNPANAANMLDEYQMQRLTDAGNYQYAANQQHQFAKQQLAQQLQEQYLKSGQEALKTPGGLTLLRSQAPDALGTDFGPTQQGIIETSLANSRDAKTANEAGSAAYHGVQAGFVPNLDRLRGMSGGLFDTAGVPLQMQIAQLKEAGSNARHASGAAAASEPNVSVQMTTSPETGSLPATVTLKKGNLNTAIPGLVARGIAQPAAPRALPSGDGTGPGASSSVAPRSTPLTPAPQPRVASTPAPQNGANIRAAAESYVENKLRISNPDAYRDAVAGKVGGKLNVQQGPDGRPYIQGKEGRH
jgi:hypothetical protein